MSNSINNRQLGSHPHYTNQSMIQPIQNLNNDMIINNQNNNDTMINNIPNTEQALNQITSEEHNINYYQEYCRLFIANVVLTTQMKEILEDKNNLLGKLSELEKKSQDLQNQEGNEFQDDKKRRFRRTATEINRHYQCPQTQCQKQYGSEGSLNQHIKIKHPEIYKNLMDGEKGSNLSQLDDSIDQNEINQDKSQQ